MLVQYLVGLCALRWDAESVAVEVKLGDMVPDEGSGTKRDVDVTVTVDAPDGVYAFKGYEVKHWGTPLDVSDIDGLVTKFNDMPSVTHRAIVSTSGYTAPAITKAEHHGIDLYVITEWTKPLEEQFPRLAPMKGPPAETIRGVQITLVWQDAQFWLGVPGAPPFNITADTTLFDALGNQHAIFSDFARLTDDLMVRSTLSLLHIPSIQDRLLPLDSALKAGELSPEEPQWDYAHTLEIAVDEVYVRVAEALHRVETLTVAGQLKWEHSQLLYCVMEKVPTSEPFAGALIGQTGVPGQMTAVIVSAKEDRMISIRQVQLDRKHLHSIRDLKLALDAEGDG